MKFKGHLSLQSWLFVAAVISLILMGVLSATASILAARGQPHTSGGTALGIATNSPTFEIPMGILEFICLSCLILASLVSIYRTIFTSKPK